MKTEMTNEEINRYIHEQVMGKCWHVSGLNQNEFPSQICDKCEMNAREPDGTIRQSLESLNREANYCSDASPRSLLNEAVAKVLVVVGRDVYDDAMEDILGPIIEAQCPRIRTQEDADEVAKIIVTAAINPTAEQISRAIVAAHKEEEGDAG